MFDKLGAKLFKEKYRGAFCEVVMLLKTSNKQKTIRKHGK